MNETHVLGGRVVRVPLPEFEGPGRAGLPRLKRLKLEKGELVQFHDGEPPIRYIAWVEFVAGGVRANHYHREKRELFCLLRGEVELLVGDPVTGERGTLVLRAGDLVDISTGVAHAVRTIEAGHGVEFSPVPYSAEDTFPFRLI